MLRSLVQILCASYQVNPEPWPSSNSRILSYEYDNEKHFIELDHELLKPVTDAMQVQRVYRLVLIEDLGRILRSDALGGPNPLYL